MSSPSPIPPSSSPTGGRDRSAAQSLAASQPGLVAVGAMLAAQWTSEVADVVVDHRLDVYGVRPHVLVGLRGIVFAPFLHSGFGHLIGNTLPFAVLGGLVALGGLRQFLSVTLIVGLVSGLGMWVFGSSNEVHIGASGLVFGYLTYLLVRGVFAHNVRQILLGIVVAFFYGGLLWGVLPTGRGISWEGHLFGVVGGVAAAWGLLQVANARSSEDPGDR